MRLLTIIKSVINDYFSSEPLGKMLFRTYHSKVFDKEDIESLLRIDIGISTVIEGDFFDKTNEEWQEIIRYLYILRVFLNENGHERDLRHVSPDYDFPPQVSLDKEFALKTYRSLYDFVIAFDEKYFPPQKKVNWHIEYLCDEVQGLVENLVPRNPKFHDLLLNIAPKELPPLFWYLVSMWAFLHDPTMKIIIIGDPSEGEEMTKVGISDIFNSDPYQRILYSLDFYSKTDEYKNELKSFNLFNIEGRGLSYSTNQGGSYSLVGQEGRLYGKHADLLITYDVTKAEVIDRLSTRRINKKTSVRIYSQQQVDSPDVRDYILSTHKNLKHIRLPMTNAGLINPAELAEYYDKETGYMNPHSTNPEVLEGLVDRFGIERFEIMYQKD